MGGIKNNLTKKLSKFLPLDREGGRRSLPDGVINNKVPLWLKGNVRRQSDKGIVLTKYSGIACLTLAILSTLILNIVSSYSSSKVNSNAEPISNSNANLSTLANTTLDPTSISISISSHSATGDTNDGNLSLSIPQGGGLVAGRHTVSINAGNEIDSYMVYLNSAVDNKALVNDENSSYTISAPSGGTSYEMPGTGIGNNTWGVALPDRYGAMYADRETYESLITNPVQSSAGSNYKDTNYPVASIASPNDFNYSNSIGERKTGNGYNVYYVVRVDDPSTMLAGDYAANVVYTVIAELKTPSITSVSPSPIRTGTTNKITLKGNNLSIVNKVTIDDRGTIRDCTNITHSGTNSDTTLTCTLPAISNTGTYVITAETGGGQTATTQIQLIPPVPSISSVTTDDGGTEIATGNSNGSVDSGEECTIQYVADNKVTCTAPSRSTAGGPYTVRLTTKGGNASKANSVSYVTPVPTVTSVSPSSVRGITSINKTVKFSVNGRNLNSVRRVVLYLDNNNPGSDSQVDCASIVTASDGSYLECSVRRWNMYPRVGSEQIRAELYDEKSNLLVSIDNFCTVSLS